MQLLRAQLRSLRQPLAQVLPERVDLADGCTKWHKVLSGLSGFTGTVLSGPKCARHVTHKVLAGHGLNGFGWPDRSVDLSEGALPIKDLDRPLWRNRNYLLLMLGTGISSLGDQIYAFVLPWLVYTITRSAFAMTSVRIVQFLPSILLGFVAGVYIDRADRRRTLMVSAALQGAFLLGMVFAATYHNTTLITLYILAFGLSSVGVMSGVGLISFLPVLVPKSQLTAANAQDSGVRTTLRLVGPVVAGGLVATVGAVMGLAVDALSFFAITVTVWLIRVALPPRTKARASVADDNREAFRFLRSCKPLGSATLAMASINLFHSSVLPLVLFRLRHDLGVSALAAGLVYSAGAIGSFAGTALVSRLARAWGWQRSFLSGFPLLVVGSVLMMVGTSTLVIGAGYGVDALGVTLLNINYFTIRQSLTPDSLLGRVVSLSSMVMKVPFPIGLFALGLLADRASGASAFAVIALGISVAGLLCARPVLGRNESVNKVEV